MSMVLKVILTCSTMDIVQWPMDLDVFIHATTTELKVIEIEVVQKSEHSGPLF